MFDRAWRLRASANAAIRLVSRDTILWLLNWNESMAVFAAGILYLKVTLQPQLLVRTAIPQVKHVCSIKYA